VDARRAATGFALLASVCFAAQHPLSKPFLDTVEAPALVMAVSAAVSVLGLPLLFLLGDGGRGCRALLSARPNRARLAILAAMGGLAAGAYVIGLRDTHTVFVALILNTSPLWAAAWARVSPERRPLPNAFFPTVGLALAAIGGSGMLSRQADPSAAVFSPWSLLLVLVPGTWTLRALLTHLWFDEKETNVYEVTAALTLVSSGALLAALGAYGALDAGAAALVAWPPVRQWLELAIGTVTGVTIGVAFYLKALRLSGDQTYVTVFNLLIPFLSAVFAWLLTWIEPTAGLAPDVWTIGGTASLLVILGYFTWRNRPVATSRR
jgi:drug/metabolite transporter (DMT)-like permease